MRDRPRGFTIIEMLFTILMTGLLVSAVSRTLVAARRANLLAESCSSELLGLQRALSWLEPDLREATRVDTDRTGTVRLETTRGTVLYRVRGGTLQRVVGGTAFPVAHGIRDLAVAPEGPLLRATVRLARPGQSGKRRPEMTCVVAPRAGEVGR